MQRQVKVLHGNKLVFGLPKGNKVRTVPLPDTVKELLAAYLLKYPAQRVELPWREPDGKPVAADLLITSRQGGALNKNYFNPAIWRKSLDRAGLPSGGTGNGMHGLRHHYASVLLDAGENIKALSEYLGHADAGFTLKTYTHLMPSSQERTRKAVDGAFACYMSATSDPENDAQQA